MDDDTSSGKPLDWIRLEDFLKIVQVVTSGGEAKRMIQGGVVRVNGEVETRRGRKLRATDTVAAPGGRTFVVADHWQPGKRAAGHPGALDRTLE